MVRICYDFLPLFVFFSFEKQLINFSFLLSLQARLEQASARGWTAFFVP
jgi:hypothetical protein